MTGARRRSGGSPGGPAFRALRGRVIAAVLAGLVVTLAGPLRAQSDPRLASAVRLAQDGQGDSARAIAQRVLDATPPADTLYPQALYTHALVAGDAATMRRDLTRITAEYPYSSWTDDALLRLAQLDYAAGDLDAATRDLERIRLDFPDSPLIPSAALWAARSYFDRNNPRAACDWLDRGLARTGTDVELRNQLQFYQQRCGPTLAAMDSAQADSARRAATADSAARADSIAKAAAAAKPKFRIQIAAVNTQAKADSVARKLKAAGYEPVVVKEKGLLKVRVGGYQTRAEAAAALPKVRTKLGGKPFVVAES
jgi:sporulation related protein/tetratricopeptide repeat protein